ncbi:MAG: prepilin-type N-terminal cleavage/methylation domain-containing protein [Candidatus Komeilibacteria bacterium]
MLGQEKKNQQGFTLLEMLVVSAIFVMTITSMVGIFVNTNRAQKRLANSEKLQADTRYVVEVMAREIRNNRVNYTFYDNDELLNQETNALDVIALADSDGNDIQFRLEGGKIQIKRSASSSEWFSITPDDIAVMQMKIYIGPSTDPYLLDGPDQQPIVYLGMTTQSLTPDLDQYKLIRYQTAISSRYYAR